MFFSFFGTLVVLCFGVILEESPKKYSFFFSNRSPPVAPSGPNFPNHFGTLRGPPSSFQSSESIARQNNPIGKLTSRFRNSKFNHFRKVCRFVQTNALVPLLGWYVDGFCKKKVVSK